MEVLPLDSRQFSKSATFCASLLACAFGVIILLMTPSSAQSAGTVGMSGGGIEENAAICTSDHCAFISAEQYASNEIRKAMAKDPKVMAQFNAEVHRHQNGYWDNTQDWWFKWLKLKNVEQTTDLDLPEAPVKTSYGPPFTSKMTYRNCGPQRHKEDFTDTDSTKASTDKTSDKTHSETVTNESSFDLSGGYESILTAKASQKITKSVQDIDREILVQHEEAQRQNKHDYSLDEPPHSITIVSSTARTRIEVYELHGILTTDALLVNVVHVPLEIMHWSDLAPDPSSRQIPIKATTRIQFTDRTLNNDLHVYADEKECEAAAAKLE